MKKNNKILLALAMAVLIVGIIYYKRDAIKTALQKLKDANKTDDKKDTNEPPSKDDGNTGNQPPPAGDEFPLALGSKGAKVTTLQTNLNKFLAENQPITGFFGTITQANVLFAFKRNDVSQAAFDSLQVMVSKGYQKSHTAIAHDWSVWGMEPVVVSIISIESTGNIHVKTSAGVSHYLPATDF